MSCPFLLLQLYIPYFLLPILFDSVMLEFAHYVYFCSSDDIISMESTRHCNNLAQLLLWPTVFAVSRPFEYIYRYVRSYSILNSNLPLEIL